MVMEMSKTYQYRKVMKPLLERKRRARINKCLDDLKDLMVECLQQEGEHVTRLEKADILELTVEHMRKLKQRGGLSLNNNNNNNNSSNNNNNNNSNNNNNNCGGVHGTATAHVESFRSGYVHAADQISQVLLQQRQTDEIAKIMKFLSARLIEMQQQLIRQSSAVSAGSANTMPPSAGYPPVQLTVPSVNAAGNPYRTSPPLPLPPAIASPIAGHIPTHSPLSSIHSPIPREYRQQPPTASATTTHIKDTDLIDVITVDQSPDDASSMMSSDSQCSSSGASEIVWRPW